MDNFKSYEFTFLYLINKCILLFKYIDIKYQKEILYEIKIFINKLQEIFSKADFKNSNDKKNKILEILIDYFEKIIDDKIYNLIICDNKENIIIDIEKAALKICDKNEKNKLEKETSFEIPFINSLSLDSNDTNKNNLNKIDKIISPPLFTSSPSQIAPKLNETNKSLTRNISDDFKNLSSEPHNQNNNFNEFEKKINNKIKNIFVEIENNIKNTLKDYLDHTQYVEYDLDKKFNEKIENNNLIMESKIKELFKEILKNDSLKEHLLNQNKLNDYINNQINYQINDIYSYVEQTLKEFSKNDKNNIILENRLIELEKNTEHKINNLNYDLKKNVSYEVENKIELLGNIFNQNIEKIFNNINSKIATNEKELLKLFEDKINNSNFNKNNFNIIFDKNLNEIQLLYCNDILTSTKINIKGLIGPKGPEGIKGDKGNTPIIRKIKVTEDKKFRFVIQEGNDIYEIISDENIPLGPQGIQGVRGDAGKSTLDLKWNQDNVMRVDEDNQESLIFLKSLCVGDKSHCVKDNSLSIAGGRCYQNNSLALGANAKTLDSESIAFYGTSVGKRAFSYRSDNVDEDTVQYGTKDKLNYNIKAFNISSKEINFECDTFRIKTNKYENNKMKELEDRIIFLEKKMVDLLKKI